MFVQDFILNQRGHGQFAQALEGVRFDPGLMRPYFDGKHKCCTVNTGRTEYNKENKRVGPVYEQVRIKDLVDNGMESPVFNATTLRKEEWIQLDQVILRAARYRLLAWADLAAANSFGGFNAMGKMVLEHETMSDPGEATVDMDALSQDRTDAPIFQLESVPLPITHSGFFFSQRRLAVSRNTGTPLDTTMGEAAARRVAEMIEKTTIGVNTGITYGPGSNSPSVGRTSSVYGYTNFTNRLTYTNNTAPTEGGWTASKTLADVLAMRDKLYANKFFGPFMIYHSNDWDQYMDNDYILTGGNVATQTLRQRIEAIKGIQGCKRLDFLFSAAPKQSTYDTLYPFTMIMVQMTPDVARAINGMDITTVQWETQGGAKLNFRVMCIQVPQLRADYYGNCGILHATLT